VLEQHHGSEGVRSEREESVIILDLRRRPLGE